MATIEMEIHYALENCGGRCQGILQEAKGYLEEIRCDEYHGNPAKYYKGRIVLQAHHIRGKSHKADDLLMLCMKCGNKRDAERRRAYKPKPKYSDENQTNMFNMPDQKKYTGPKTVPNTSIQAFNEAGTKKSMEGGVKKAFNLLRKAPGRTAYELFQMTSDFPTIYDLRRYLSELKNRKRAWNPEERMCKVAKRKTFTWRLV